MEWKRGALLMAGAIAVLGAVAWLGFATGQGAPVDTAADGASDVARGTAPTDVANEPPPAPPTIAPPSPTPPSPSLAINGLHVLCPVKGGGYAHLLLTSQTYYKAVTPEEEARLTELLGPPVANVDPNELPPRSPTSVTDALNQLTT